MSIDQYTAGSSTQYALHTSFKLNYILRCPHASTNLLSVHKFTKNYVCCFELDANGSIVKDKNMGGPFSSGRLRTYCILSCCIPWQMCFTVNLACKDRSSISYVLQYLLSKFSLFLAIVLIWIINLCVLHWCQLVKSMKFPCSLSSSFPPNRSEVVHSDEWGRAPISSIRGFNYCISFIDIALTTIGYILEKLFSASHFLCGSMLVLMLIFLLLFVTVYLEKLLFLCWWSNYVIFEVVFLWL